jgi:hypothetical protein
MNCSQVIDDHDVDATGDTGATGVAGRAGVAAMAGIAGDMAATGFTGPPLAPFTQPTTLPWESRKFPSWNRPRRRPPVLNTEVPERSAVARPFMSRIVSSASQPHTRPARLWIGVVIASSHGSTAVLCCLQRMKKAGLRDRNRPLTWVELRGFEPLTFCMPCRRATSCAIAPQPQGRPFGAPKVERS